MLYTIALILLVLWARGLVTSYTLGGFIHVLLVVAVVIGPGQSLRRSTNAVTSGHRRSNVTRKIEVDE